MASIGSSPYLPTGEPIAAPPSFADVIARPPFAKKVLCLRQFCMIAQTLDYAIAVPARNEALFLGRMLSALASSMRGSPARGGAVFVVNDTQDASPRMIEAWARDEGIPVVLLETVFAPEIRNAPHVRRLALDIAAQFAPTGTLLTTDADSHVGPAWIDTCLTAIAQGTDLACEDIRLDETELAALPDTVRRVGELERAYFRASDALWQRWTRGEAGAFAYRASGASMAMRTAAYLEAGRLPTPESGEDGALCRAMLSAGMRVSQITDTGTRTSARLDGRARRGCGDALAQRALLADPPCDPTLVTVAELRHRALLWNASTPARLRAGPAAGTFPDRNPPMLASEVERELAHALAVLEQHGQRHASV